MTIRIAVAITVLLFAANSYAIDCSGLDKQSNAYQTCKLRDELQNRERSEAWRRAEKENATKPATEPTNRDARAQENKNLFKFADLQDAEKSNLIKAGMDPSKEPIGCTIVGGDGFGYVFQFCRGNVLFLTALNATYLAEELTGPLINKTLKSVSINSYELLDGTTKYIVNQHQQGLAIFFIMGNLPEFREQLFRLMNADKRVEILFASDQRSHKVILENYELQHMARKRR